MLKLFILGFLSLPVTFARAEGSCDNKELKNSEWLSRSKGASKEIFLRIKDDMSWVYGEQKSRSGKASKIVKKHAVGKNIYVEKEGDDLWVSFLKTSKCELSEENFAGVDDRMLVKKDGIARLEAEEGTGDVPLFRR